MIGQVGQTANAEHTAMHQVYGVGLHGAGRR